MQRFTTPGESLADPSIEQVPPATGKMEASQGGVFADPNATLTGDHGKPLVKASSSALCFRPTHPKPQCPTECDWPTLSVGPFRAAWLTPFPPSAHKCLISVVRHGCAAGSYFCSSMAQIGSGQRTN